MSDKELGPSPTLEEVAEQCRWLTQRVNILLDIHHPNIPHVDIALLKHKVRILEERVSFMSAPKLLPVKPEPTS